MIETFGFEFEGAVQRGRRHSFYFQEHLLLNWGYQYDYSVAWEVSTPPFSDFKEAYENCKEQFKHLAKHYAHLKPIVKGMYRNMKIGGHIHLGDWNGIEASEAVSIASRLVDTIAFLYYISGNGEGIRNGRWVISKRIINPYSPFVNKQVLAQSVQMGRNEFSYSHHETLECRGFDGNIPAVQVALAFLLKTIANTKVKIPAVDDGLLKKQVILGDLRAIIEAWKQVKIVLKSSSVDLPEIPAVRSILKIAFNGLLNPAQLKRGWGVGWEWLCNDVKINFPEIRVRDVDDLVERIVITPVLWARMKLQGVDEEELARLTGAEIKINGKVKEEGERLLRKNPSRYISSPLKVEELPNTILPELYGLLPEPIKERYELRGVFESRLGLLHSTPRWFFWINKGRIEGIFGVNRKSEELVYLWIRPESVYKPSIKAFVEGRTWTK